MPITQLHPGAITGRRYGSFSGKTPAATRFAAWFTGGPPKKRQNPKKQQPRRATVADVIPLIKIWIAEASCVFRQPIKRAKFTGEINTHSIQMKSKDFIRSAPSWIADQFKESQLLMQSMQDDAELSEVLSILRVAGVIRD